MIARGGAVRIRRRSSLMHSRWYCVGPPNNAIPCVYMSGAICRPYVVYKHVLLLPFNSLSCCCSDCFTVIATSWRVFEVQAKPTPFGPHYISVGLGLRCSIALFSNNVVGNFLRNIFHVKMSFVNLFNCIQLCFLF